MGDVLLESVAIVEESFQDDSPAPARRRRVRC